MRQYFLSIRSFFLLLAVGAAFLGATGCGDDGSSPADDNSEVNVETGSLSKKQFIQQADEICSEAASAVQRAGEKYGRERASADSPAAAEAMLKVQLPRFITKDLIPAFEEQIDEVSSLGAPSGDEQKVTEILKEMQQGLDAVKGKPEDFFQGNSSLQEAAELGRAYGFEQCGSLA